MNGWVGWVLGDVALPVALLAAACLLVAVLRAPARDLAVLARSTLFMRRVHAYEEARSRTPGGSTYPPDGTVPQPPSGVNGSGVEARPALTAPPPAPQPRSAWGDGPPHPALTGPDTTTDSPDRQTPSHHRSGSRGPGVEATPAQVTPPPVSLPQTSGGVGELLPPRPRTPRGSTPQRPVGDGHANG